MTINAMLRTLLALYIAGSEKTGVAASPAHGHDSNRYLKVVYGAWNVHLSSETIDAHDYWTFCLCE